MRPIFQRSDGEGRPGDHPSDHSAIYFDIYSVGWGYGDKLFSWNAEGSVMLSWFANSSDIDTINDIINGDNLNFGEVYELCSLLDKSVLSQEEQSLINQLTH